jgi:hypothetical protein
MLVTVYQTATCTDLENHNIILHHNENLIFKILLWLFFEAFYTINGSEAGRNINRVVERICM